MRLRLAILVAATVAFTLLPAVPAQASNFIVTCPFSHSLSDDPILYPGQPGASHRHDFFGNRTTNASSTYETLRAGTTTCNDSGDTAAYWVPALFANGVKQDPTRAKAYYFRDNAAPVQAPPANFKLIAGDPHATAPPSVKVLYWGCGNGSGVSKQTAPPDCTGISSFLEVHVLFPDCWDGVTVSGNAADHMRYSTTNGGACPAGFPVRFPRLVLAVFYNPPPTGVTLSSGAYFTYHADFWNAWNQARLETRTGLL